MTTQPKTLADVKAGDKVWLIKALATKADIVSVSYVCGDYLYEIHPDGWCKSSTCKHTGYYIAKTPNDALKMIQDSIDHLELSKEFIEQEIAAIPTEPSKGCYERD